MIMVKRVGCVCGLLLFMGDGCASLAAALVGGRWLVVAERGREAAGNRSGARAGHSRRGTGVPKERSDSPLSIRAAKPSRAASLRVRPCAIDTPTRSQTFPKSFPTSLRNREFRIHCSNIRPSVSLKLCKILYLVDRKWSYILTARRDEKFIL
jgi:hypothetical protein